MYSSIVNRQNCRYLKSPDADNRKGYHYSNSQEYLFPHTVRLFNATSCHYLISNLGLTGSVSLMM